jgi:predicted HD phosphohydrolase
MTAEELLDLLAELANVPSEDADSLSALDHGLQCAAELLARRPEDVGLQLAGLVHDIGHQFGHDEDHAMVGAEQVRPALGDRVAALVGAHVTAKRYLVTSEPTYRFGLSEDSVRSLELQGGRLSPEEERRYLSSPHAADATALRRADDAAKVRGRKVPSLDAWVSVLRNGAR